MEGMRGPGKGDQSRGRNKRRKRRRKKRRGQGKREKKTTQGLSILFANCRGYVSKKESIFQIVDKIKPSVICLNETGLRGNNKVNIDGYISFSKNRAEQIMGGISTSVTEEWRQHLVCAGEGEGDDEYHVIRLDNFSPAINIINCYGEQDKDEKVVVGRWGRLRKEMEVIVARQEHCLLVSDTNKHIGCDELGVAGNHAKVSRGGHLVRALLSTGEWVLINNMPGVVEGGPFTRVDPASGALSCLDLFICSTGLAPYVKRLWIDSKRELAMKRGVRRGGKFRTIFADHFTNLLEFSKDLPKVNTKVQKVSRWNLKKENGWTRYEDVSNRKAEKIEKIVAEAESIEDVGEEIDKVDNKIKFKAFGKVTLGNTKKSSKSKDDVDEGFFDEEEEAKDLIEKGMKRAEEVINKLKMENKSENPTVFQIAKTIQGPKKTGVEAVAIKDPKKQTLVVSAKEIKKVTLEYCKDNLTNDDFEEGFERDKELLDQIHEERMKVRLDEKMEVQRKEFDKTVNKCETSGKRNYDFLVKSGELYKTAIYKYNQRMITEECFPGSFNKTVLHMVFKGGRGKRKEDLPSNRFLHCKLWPPRLTEGLVINEMKGTILRKSSKFQIGGQPGHRPQEHLFTMRSVIARNMMKKTITILQTYDIHAFFDQEKLRDCMNTLWRMNVNPGAWRCWYKLNKSTSFQVLTGVGATDWAEIGECVGQGSKGKSLVSQANLDMGVRDLFHGSEDEIKYGSVEMGPCLLQDDILRAAGSLESAKAGNAKLNMVMCMKGIQLNQDKTCYTLYGSKKLVEEARAKLEKRPLWCGKFVTAEKQAFKYLGDMFDGRGLGASVVATLRDRLGKAKGECLEIAVIVEDWRSQVTGGFLTALKLYEACVVSSLLYNCGTWTEMNKEAEDIIEDFQRWFVKLILRQGPGCPKPSLRSETGLLSMVLRVWKEKALLVRHFRSLPASAMANQIWNEQRRYGWPGLAKEVSEICTKLGMEDANLSEMTENAFKKEIQLKCEERDECDLKRSMESLQKMEKVKMEDCRRKEYMSRKPIQEVRELFAERLYLLPFGGNFSKDKRFLPEDWKCVGCIEEVPEQQDHVATSCPGYSDIREKYDLMTDDGLIHFYREVLERRNPKTE